MYFHGNKCHYVPLDYILTIKLWWYCYRNMYHFKCHTFFPRVKRYTIRYNWEDYNLRLSK